MKKFYNSKSRVIFMLVFALLLQIVGPVVLGTAEETAENGEVLTEEKEPDQKQEEGEASDEKVDKNDQEAEELDQEQEEGGAGESEPGEETETDEVNTPKDLGNIFTLNYFKVNGSEANENQVVDITDGTTVNLEYTWTTEGKDAKVGDWAEIDVPDAFKLDRTF